MGVELVELRELAELDGETHGEFVHSLGPGPFTITQALLRHSVWLTVIELVELRELGVTQGEFVHSLGPGPLTTTQALLRHSVWLVGGVELEELLELSELVELTELRELEGGDTHGEYQHSLGPGPLTTTHALLRHSV